MASSIEFGKISYHNFMSFADQEWDFSKKGDIFLISGINHDLSADDSGVPASNGSGKTNLVQGLMYCLYGQFPSKIHNSNIINKYSKNPDSEGYVMRVTLDFVIKGDETKQYRIIRGCQKKSSASMMLSLFEYDGANWKEISKSSSALTQQYIEELLHMSFQSFQRLVMLSCDQSFNFFQMSAAQKREFIQALFDTGVYNDMWEVIKKDQNRFSMALQGEKVRQNTLQGQLANCEQEIKNYAATAKQQEAEIINQIKVIEEETLVDLRTKQEELTKKISNIKVSVGDLDEKRTKYSDVVNKIKYRIYTAEQTVAMLKKTIDSCKREISKHNDILNIVCDDCETKIRKLYNLDEYEKDITDSEKQVGERNVEINKLRDALNKANDEISKIQDQKIKIDNEIAQLDSQLTGFQLEERSELTKASELKRRQEEIHDSISDPKKIPMMSTYKSLKKSIHDCDKAVKAGEDDLYYLNLCEKVVSPESVRKNIVSRVIQSINDLVNKFLEQLNTTIKCEFDDQLDKYTIFAPKGWNIDYQNLSKGERMKLLLATQLAFRRFLLMRLNTRCNCFILDEIIDQNFDTLSISRILNVLLDISTKDDTHIYIISHRGEVAQLTKDLVENNINLADEIQNIRVEKSNDISKVVVLGT